MSDYGNVRYERVGLWNRLSRLSGRAESPFHI